MDKMSDAEKLAERKAAVVKAWRDLTADKFDLTQRAVLAVALLIGVNGALASLAVCAITAEEKLAKIAGIVNSVGVCVTIILTWMLIRNDFKRAQREEALAQIEKERADREKAEAKDKSEAQIRLLVAEKTYRKILDLFRNAKGNLVLDLMRELAVEHPEYRAAIMSGVERGLQKTLSSYWRVELQRMMAVLDAEEPQKWPLWHERN